jgi:hypothetical protein
LCTREESEEESLEWSCGDNSNSSAFTWQCFDAIMTKLQHDSDRESSDDYSADLHEDSIVGEEEMKRRRNLLHHHSLKVPSFVKVNPLVSKEVMNSLIYFASGAAIPASSMYSTINKFAL